jgi:hypothetical protein
MPDFTESNKEEYRRVAGVLGRSPVNSAARLAALQLDLKQLTFDEDFEAGTDLVVMAFCRIGATKRGLT